MKSSGRELADRLTNASRLSQIHGHAGWPLPSRRQPDRGRALENRLNGSVYILFRCVAGPVSQPTNALIAGQAPYAHL
jgi:hypothetical protein